MKKFFKKINKLEILQKIRNRINADCKKCTSECDCDDDCTRYYILNLINKLESEAK